jgi:hypothetical protein
MLTETYLDYVFSYVVTGKDAKNAFKNYKTGLYGVGEIRSYIYSLCLRRIIKEGHFDEMRDSNYDYILAQCKQILAYP